MYRISLIEFEPLVPRLYPLLQPDEQNRAGRYHRPADQHRFIIVRGLLRILLGLHSQQEPTAIRFEIDSQKKPRLQGFPDIHYNVSHSGDWALITMARLGVGIDVEQIIEKFRFEEVVRHSFSTFEQEYVRAAESEPYRAFYQLWTRKEALLKATAKGLTDDVVMAPSLDGWHYPEINEIGQNGLWLVRSFHVVDTYQGAIAFGPVSHQPPIVFMDVSEGLIGR